MLSIDYASSEGVGYKIIKMFGKTGSKDWDISNELARQVMLGGLGFRNMANRRIVERLQTRAETAGFFRGPW